MISRFFTWLALKVLARRHRRNLSTVENAIKDGSDPVEACRKAGVELDPEVVEILNSRKP